MISDHLILGGHLFTIIARQDKTLKYGSQKENLMLYKVLFMLFTVVVYIIGKSLPLYMIDVEAYADATVSAEELLLQAIKGDRYQFSLFALGISPYMISSIATQMFVAFKSSEAKARISPKKMNRFTVQATLLLAVLMAVMQVPKLHFKIAGDYLLIAQCIAGMEMVAGAMLIIWLSDRNKKYGIGGQSALIFINLFDSFSSNLKGHTSNQMLIALLLTLMSVSVMAIFENTEKRIPLQRVSIHNIYADKNYLAIKMNPIGVMPAMFSMAVFTLMQLIVEFTGWFVPEHPAWLWCRENMVLSKPFGICMYILGLYVLSVGFSRVILNPQETTEQFLKSGDSIVNIHAGKDTKRYLSKTINRLSFLSATMMSACLALPLILQMQGRLEGSLAALPSSAMFLVGIVCNIIREFAAVRDLEGYKPFI